MSEELRQALEAAERRFRNVIEKNADGIVIVDSDGHVRFANPEAEALFGRSRTELEEHALGFPLVAGKTTEVDVLQSNQHTTVAEMRVVETEWEGEPAFLASLRDVTDRKRLEQERRQHMEERIARVQAEATSRRLRLMTEAGALLASSVDDGAAVQPFTELVVGRFADWCVVSLDTDPEAPGPLPRFTAAHRSADGRKALEEHAAWFDPQAPRFPGLEAAWKGTSPVLLREADLGGEQTIFPGQLRSVLHVGLDAENTTFGTVSFGLAAGPTPDLLPHAIYQPSDQILAQELARHLALHLENARLYRQAEDANRLRDEFLATISHELRTPLQAILGWTEILRQPDLSDEDVQRAARVVERNAQAQQHLIEDMLDVSRIITGGLRLELQDLDVLDPVRAAIQAVEPTADAKGVALSATFDEPLPRVTADPNRLQQVVWNLLSNGIKFTPEGGRVEVTVRRQDDSVVIRVTDDGKGIDPQLLPQVFRRFRRGGGLSGRGSTAGLGLGLSIVQHLVEMHGGRVRAESDGPGRGAVFSVYLPLQSDETSHDLPEMKS